MDEENADPPELTSEEKEFNSRAIFKVAPVLVVASLIFMGTTGVAFFSGTISLSGGTKVEALESFSGKLEFTSKFLTLGVLWLLLCIFMVIMRRLFVGAINPLASKSREMYLKRFANILQNSLEQFLISSFAQIALVNYIPGSVVLFVIPWVNFLFFIGRLSFTIGYPNYRGFGMLMTLLPNIVMVAFVSCKWIQFAFFS